LNFYKYHFIWFWFWLCNWIL